MARPVPLPKLPPSQQYEPFADGAWHCISQGGSVKLVYPLQAYSTVWMVRWPGMQEPAEIHKATGLLKGKSRVVQWRLDERERAELLRREQEAKCQKPAT